MMRSNIMAAAITRAIYITWPKSKPEKPLVRR